MSKKRPDLHAISAARWRELYCDPESPSMSELARRFGTTGETIAQLLRQHGITIRSHAQQEQIELKLGRKAREKKRPDVHAISAARWWELYWGPESGFPSLSELGRRWGVSPRIIAQLLRQHGITVRSLVQQTQIELKLGRKARGNSRGNSALGVWSHLHRGRKHSPKTVAKIAAALRRPVTRPCGWCAAPITRPPHRFRDVVALPGPCCCPSHVGNLAQHFLRHPEEPRPLILARLRVLAGSGPITYERLLRIGEPIGAREPEILELLTEGLEQ